MPRRRVKPYQRHLTADEKRSLHEIAIGREERERGGGRERRKYLPELLLPVIATGGIENLHAFQL